MVTHKADRRLLFEYDGFSKDSFPVVETPYELARKSSAHPLCQAVDV